MSRDNKKNKDQEDKTFENKLFELLFGANIGRRIAIFIVIVLIAIFFVNNVGLFDSININFNNSNESSNNDEAPKSDNKEDVTEDVRKGSPSFKINIIKFNWMTRELDFPTHLHVIFKLSMNETAKEYEIRMIFRNESLINYDVIPTTSDVFVIEKGNNKILIIKGINLIDTDYIELYAIVDQPSLDRIEMYAKNTNGSVWREIITSEVLKKQYNETAPIGFKATMITIAKMFIWVTAILGAIFLILLFGLLIYKIADYEEKKEK